MLRGVVADDLGLEFEKDAPNLVIANVEVNEAHARGNVLAPASAVRPQAVDHDDFVSELEVTVDDVRADEPCSAGDDDAHRRGFRRRRPLSSAARVANEPGARTTRDSGVPGPRYDRHCARLRA